MNFVNHNGKIIDSGTINISSANSAFRYGYGLFETMLVRDEIIMLEEYHWERLFEGMKKLLFTIPVSFTKEILQEEVMRCVKKNKLEKLCRVRLQVYTEMNGLYDDKKMLPEFFIECFPLEDQITQWNENGLICGIAKDIKKTNDLFANLKTCNMMVYAMAAKQAKENKWNDALICNTQGNIIESAIANIFWVKDRMIFTPPLSEGCIGGVMRRHLMKILSDNGYSVNEKSLTPNTLLDVDEVFLTNSIRGIKWIKSIAAKIYDNKITSAIIYKK